MTDGDPKRLLEAPGATSEERDLLRSSLDASPPRDAHAAVWGALATRLPGIGGGAGPDGGGGVGGGGGAGAGATGVSTGVKVAGALALAGLIAGGIAIATTNPRNPPTPVSSPPAPPAAPPTTGPASDTPVPAAPSAAGIHALAPDSAGLVLAPPPRPNPKTTPSSGSSAPATPRAAALREEAALLAAARDALHGGDARRALTILDEARAKHPSGVLAQEREVVTIEALSQAGDKSGASRHAESFLRAFPASPHSSHVRTFLAR